MTDAPYCPVYFGDLLTDTQHLSEAEFGSYVRLLGFMWRTPSCTLPLDMKKLARLSGCSVKAFETRRWPAIEGFFDEIEPGVFTQKRLLFERKKVADIASKRATSGRRGGRAKALKNQETPLANAAPLLKQTGWQNSSMSESYSEEGSRDSPPGIGSEPLSDTAPPTLALPLAPEDPGTSGPPPKSSTGRNSYPDDFEAFWRAYPKTNGSKAATFSAWRAVANQRPDLPVLLAKVEAFTRTREVYDGKIVWPDRWLKQQRWTVDFIPYHPAAPRLNETTGTNRPGYESKPSI